ncbi:MAG: aminopeptidase P family protein [Defluviitaleaceae bacterium]|nr:aminopeptidase P family protein [Defluviitaleaceae bacterium]
MPHEKLSALRKLMAERGINAYIITSADAHASEYTAPFWRGREWISGFTGSAGIMVIFPEEAGLWTDGRYFIQAEKELEGSGIKLFKHGEPNVQKYTEYLAKNLPASGKLGFDARTVTAADFLKIKEALQDKKISFAHNEDLLDEIWVNRPPMPEEKAFEHAPQFAGKSAKEKLADVRAIMKKKNIAAYLVTAPESTAWLANLRGRDIPCLPVVYAFSLITQDEAHIFIDPQKIESTLLPDFTLHDYNSLPSFLKNFKTEKIYYNPTNTNVQLTEAIPIKSELKPADDIIPLLKAVKTHAELANIKNAFIKEGVVLTKMLFWLHEKIKERPVTEGEIARVLQKTRKTQAHYICDSFTTICAYGSNAAQAHYNCGETGAVLHERGFLLIDTGGQYLDGTTDTTRTICLGEITDEMKRDFTLVLKGNIALSHAVFPSGTTGSALDILARQALWESGQNYRHGTGHGIGYCLSVHEGPHNISQTYNAVALAPGMLVSNEPAIYKENRYGIRTENILCVTEKKPGGTFLTFETLTHCPIDTRAISPELLTPTERGRLNDYHKRTYEVLSPHLTTHEREWLKQATHPI